MHLGIRDGDQRAGAGDGESQAAPFPPVLDLPIPSPEHAHAEDSILVREGPFDPELEGGGRAHSSTTNTSIGHRGVIDIS